MKDKIKGGLADNMTLDSIAEKHGVTLSVIESALADGIAVEMEHTDDKEQAEEIAKDHLFEDAEYYRKLAKVEKQNSKDWAKTYKASNFIEKGVCTYQDETIFLSQECLNKAIASIKGRPVVIKHQKVDPSNMQDHAVGYVSDCGFCDQEASFYCNFLVFDDEGKEVIAKDYSVSCAYIPKAFSKGGTWHNTPYDREVTELEFTHLALVPDPRYEDAKIYENAMDDEGDWITVKGTHIFIPKGQSKEEAIKSFWETKKDNKKVINFSDYKYKEEDLMEKIFKKFYKGENPEYALNKGAKLLLAVSKNKEYLEKNLETKLTDDQHKNIIEDLKSLAINITEKQNSTDNTTKEIYNMEKIEVEQGFLASLIELAQKPFMNSKKEDKEEDKDIKDVKVDDDEMEYEGKKYSKKELVNAFEAACAGKKAKEEEEKKNALEAEAAAKLAEEEKENGKDSDDDMEFFNSMQKLMAEASSDASDKVEIPSQNKGLELGSKAFG